MFEGDSEITETINMRIQVVGLFDQEANLAQGNIALADRVGDRDAPQTRAIFIESIALYIRNVEGSFIAKQEKAIKPGLPERRDNNATR